MPRSQQIKERSKNELYERGVTGVQSGQHSSSYSAAKSLGISRRTLDRRLKGTQPRTSAHAEQQNRLEAEESALVKWITTLTMTGMTPSYSIIKEMADAIRQDRVASINDDDIELISYRPLSKYWLGRFLKHHPKLIASFAYCIDTARVNQSTENQIK